MRAGHLIYKVKDLEQGVEAWRKKGFAVEYGSKTNPYNAIIYFSNGPYIELLASTGMPAFFKRLLRLLGRKGVANRFDSWDYGEERWCGFCIEKDSGNLDLEIERLGGFKQNGFYLKHGKRTDINDRKLKYKCFFPSDISLPFLMSYFNIDPKPKDFVHPNGYRRVSKIKFATTAEAASVIKSLLEDASVEIEVTGEQGVVKNVEFE
jgi:hypothetical protein